jgi:hypothetical protein
LPKNTGQVSFALSQTVSTSSKFCPANSSDGYKYVAISSLGPDKRERNRNKIDEDEGG